MHHPVGRCQSKSAGASAGATLAARHDQSVPLLQNVAPEIIRFAVMMYVRFPLSLRIVENRRFERGINISHETVRFWWNRFGPLFAAKIRKRRVDHRRYSNWRRHLDEVFVRVNGEPHYFWRAVDNAGEVLEVLVAKRRDRTTLAACRDAASRCPPW